MKRREWTDEEVEYLGYVVGKQSYQTIAKILNRSVSSVKHKVYKLDLQEKQTGDRKEWTEEEIEYLRKHYRKKSAKLIAKKLHRTIESVKHAAERYGTYDASLDGLSLRTVAEAFDCDLCVVKRWVNKYDMPVDKRKIGKGIYYNVYGEKFWEWALEHKDIIPIKKYKKTYILPEPDEIYNTDGWNDKPINHRRPLSKTDINFIVALKKSGMSIEDIAKRVDRTVYAVEHILRDNYK